MKTTFLLNVKNYFTYFLALSVLAGMSSCSNSNYTASFQNVPAKTYAHAEKTATPGQSGLALQEELPVEDSKEVIEQPSLEIPEDITASLKELGISEKKSAKIQKRIEKLNEALVKAEANPSEMNEGKKMNIVEKMVVKKALKKAEKIMAKNDITDVENLEEAKKAQQRGNITLGLILILAGVLVAVLVPAPGAIIGSIVAAIGIVLLILGLL